MLRQIQFGWREEWSNRWSGLASYCLYPLYVLVLSQMWLRLRISDEGMTPEQMLTYVAVAEALLMTTLNSLPADEVAGDFSFALIRPQPWSIFYGSLAFGRCLGRRLIYLALAALVVSLYIADDSILSVSFRVLSCLPILTVAEVALSLIWVLVHVLFANITHLRFAILKVLMVMGGVLFPLHELTSRWRDVLIALPPADLIFQPAYFAVHGCFYGITGLGWLARIIVEVLGLGLFTHSLFIYARHRQIVYGG